MKFLRNNCHYCEAGSVDARPYSHRPAAAAFAAGGGAEFVTLGAQVVAVAVKEFRREGTGTDAAAVLGEVT